jgi:hypothetical protein
MPYQAPSTSYTAEDIRKLQEDLKILPAGASRRSVVRTLMEKWGKSFECMNRWVMIAQSFSPSVIDAFEKGQINRDRLQMIARYNFRIPSYKSYLAEQTIKEGLTQKKIEEVKDLIYSGKHPAEAIAIVLGRRSETPITRDEAYSIESSIRDIETLGRDWRKKWEYLRMMTKGGLQVIQNGRHRNRLLYDAVAMKVAADDVARFAAELVGEIPKEITEAIRIEIQGSPSDLEVSDPGPGPDEPLRLVDARTIDERKEEDGQ